MSKVKVAVIGCGTIANNAHIPSYMNNPDAEIKYFCDIIPERAKAAVEKYGCGTAIEDYHVALNDPEIEAVSVCTPNRMHSVIAIDALAAGDPERVGTTVQICDSGISPGSGVSNRRKELSRRTLGIPVIAIGVPTVVDYPRGNDPEPMMVTPREIDTVIENAARTIAMAVNCALQPELSLEDLMALTQ